MINAARYKAYGLCHFGGGAVFDGCTPPEWEGNPMGGPNLDLALSTLKKTAHSCILFFYDVIQNWIPNDKFVKVNDLNYVRAPKRPA